MSSSQLFLHNCNSHLLFSCNNLSKHIRGHLRQLVVRCVVKRHVPGNHYFHWQQIMNNHDLSLKKLGFHVCIDKPARLTIVPDCQIRKKQIVRRWHCLGGLNGAVAAVVNGYLHVCGGYDGDAHLLMSPMMTWQYWSSARLLWFHFRTISLDTFRTVD